MGLLAKEWDEKVYILFVILVGLGSTKTSLGKLGGICRLTVRLFILSLVVILGMFISQTEPVLVAMSWVLYSMEKVWVLSTPTILFMKGKFMLVMLLVKTMSGSIGVVKSLTLRFSMLV